MEAFGSLVLSCGMPCWFCQVTQTQTAHQYDARHVLHSLHWPPVRHRITYEMVILTCKILVTSMPAYLSDLTSLAVPRRHLRLSHAPLLLVTRTRTDVARRAFSVTAAVYLELAVWQCSLVHFNWSFQTSFKNSPIHLTCLILASRASLYLWTSWLWHRINALLLPLPLSQRRKYCGRRRLECIELYVNTYPTYFDKLIKLNNTLLRILQFKTFDFPTLQLYKNFKTLPLSSLYEQQVLMFVHIFVHHSYKLSPVFVDYFRSKNLVHDHNKYQMWPKFVPLWHIHFFRPQVSKISRIPTMESFTILLSKYSICPWFS